jgi:[ribosomal protein S18]-alanine N-acetyltransferase
MNPPLDDLDRIMEVMELAFDPAYGEAWNRRQVSDALLFGSSHYMLVSPSGKTPADGEMAAGFYLSRSGVDEEELLLLAVAPAWRNNGLGQRLLEHFAAAAASRGAERLLLEMRDNNPADQLYRRFGFEPIGRRNNYYRTGDGQRLDAITFARKCE